METEPTHSPGYSAESLKMLETAEGQTNAVFACFGSAAQHAQLFEQGLSRFLITYNKLCNDDLSIEKLDAIASGLHKKTMGQLLKKLSQHVTVEDDSVFGEFEVALRQRNYLMHEFFLERNSELESEEGRMRLLKELLTVEGYLERSRVRINAMRIAMCETLGIDDEFYDFQ